MKYIFAALAIIIAASAQAQQNRSNSAAYWSGQGESLVLLREPCPRPDFPPSAKKATYVAHMQIIDGCYVMAGPDEVVVTMPNGQSRKMHRIQFKSWELN